MGALGVASSLKYTRSLLAKKSIFQDIDNRDLVNSSKSKKEINVSKEVIASIKATKRPLIHQESIVYIVMIVLLTGIAFYIFLSYS